MKTKTDGPRAGEHQATFLRPDGINVVDCPRPNCWTRVQHGVEGLAEHLMTVHEGRTPERLRIVR